MGFGGIGVWQLIIVLLIIILIFGTGKIRNIGSDIGHAIKGFRKNMGRLDTDSPEREVSAPPEDEATG